jgi:hypothetical protein
MIFSFIIIDPWLLIDCRDAQIDGQCNDRRDEQIGRLAHDDHRSLFDLPSKSEQKYKEKKGQRQRRRRQLPRPRREPLTGSRPDRLN